MAAYRNHWPALQDLRVGVAAVSVDDGTRARAVRDELDLPFPLLCDPGRVVVEAWNLLNRIEFEIARPSTFIVDRGGTVLSASVDRNYVRSDPADVVACLRAWRETGQFRQPRRRVALPPPSAIWLSAVNALRYGIRPRKPA